MTISDIPYRRSNTKLRIVLVAVVGVVMVAAIGGYLLWPRHASNKGDGSKNESAQVLTSVGQLYMLPGDEQPTVAAIQDVSKLSGQAFFKNAQNGDYLLVYSNAKLALLYRKSVNKLVNVGPVNLGDNAKSAAKQQR